MLENGWVIFGFLVFMVCVVVFGLYRKRQLEQQGGEDMKMAHPTAMLIDTKAVYYGLQSKGTVQTHELGGNLVLAPDLVRFKTWDYGGEVLGIERTFDITLPKDRLTGFETTNKFVSLGPGARTKGLVLLHFTDENGAADILAVCPTDKEACVSHLRTLGLSDLS